MNHELHIRNGFYYCPCGWATEDPIPDDVDATEDYGPYLTAAFDKHIAERST